MRSSLEEFPFFSNRRPHQRESYASVRYGNHQDIDINASEAPVRAVNAERVRWGRQKTQNKPGNRCFVQAHFAKKPLDTAVRRFGFRHALKR